MIRPLARNKNTECAIDTAEIRIDDENAERMRMRRFLESCTSRRKRTGVSTRTESAKTSAIYGSTFAGRATRQAWSLLMSCMIATCEDTEQSNAMQ